MSVVWRTEIVTRFGAAGASAAGVAFFAGCFFAAAKPGAATANRIATDRTTTSGRPKRAVTV